MGPRLRVGSPMLSRWPTTRAGEEVMRRLIVALTVLCAGALAALVPVIDSSAATRRTGGPVGVPGTWHPVFADEFGGTGLDPATWRPGWFGTGITGPVNGAERACYRGSHATVPGDGPRHRPARSRTGPRCGPTAKEPGRRPARTT